MFKFIHGADFHLDSPFGALSAPQAAQRRRESRELPARLANYVREHRIDLVLLAGDLFDSARVFRQTGEELSAALAQMSCPVVISPGNHDWYGPGSPWLSVSWPDNVHIFSRPELTSLDLPQLNTVVHGAAFSGPEQSEGFLTGFAAPRDGRIHLGLLHGELDASRSPYHPITREEVAASGLAYLALGHIHKRSEPLRLGQTLCAWPGCPEGHGFDELGEKGVYEGTVSDDGQVTLTFVPFARRRYEIVTVDVTGHTPQAAVEKALPQDTVAHLYRIVLTGETEAAGVDLPALQEMLAGRFFALELQDQTHMSQDVWARAQEDSLRGLFLRRLRERWEQAQSEQERVQITQAARFGLAALDHRDLG